MYLLCNFQLVYMLMAKSEAFLSFIYSFSIWVAFDFSPVWKSIVNIFVSNNLVNCKIRFVLVLFAIFIFNLRWLGCSVLCKM